MKFIKYTFYLYLCFIISFVSTKSLLKQTPSSINNKIVLQNNSLLSCIDTCVHGQCITNNTVCQCNEGYITEETNKSNMKCTYKQKSQLAAFLFELFLPFGVGHLYVGRYLFGITKMIIVTSPLTICLFTFLGILVSDKFLNGGNSSLVCIGVVFLFSIVGLVWWVADLVLFGTNNYSDGNNVPLNPW